MLYSRAHLQLHIAKATSELNRKINPLRLLKKRNTQFQNSITEGIVKFKFHFSSKNIKDFIWVFTKAEYKPMFSLALHSFRALFCESILLHLYFTKVNHSLTTMDNMLGLFFRYMYVCIYILVSLVFLAQGAFGKLQI